MSELTEQQIRESIQPRTDQLNADSLLSGPITVTVENATAGNTEQQPVVLAISGGHQVFKPCKSMRRVLVAAWGDRAKSWIGRRMTLFCDPDVIFGGVRVGGIRISHLSDIEKDTLTMSLTIAKAKKKEFTVKRLESESQSIPEETANQIRVCIDTENRVELVALLKSIPSNEKAAVWNLLSGDDKSTCKRVMATGELFEKGNGDEWMKNYRD